MESSRGQSEALFENDDPLRLSVDSIPVMIRTCGLDMAATYFNRKWLEFSGKTLPDMVGGGWTWGIHPSDLRQTLARFEEAFRRQLPIRLEYRYCRADGEYRWLLDEAAPRFSPKGAFRGYIGSSIDITSHKHAEEGLIRRTRQLETLVDNAPDPIIRFNRQFQIEFANRRAVMAFGLPEDRFVGGYSRDLAAPTGVSDLLERTLSDVASVGEPREIEFTWPKPAGQRSYQLCVVPEFGPDFAVQTLLGIARDMTTQKQVEAALRESEHQLSQSEQRYRSLFDHNFDGVFSLDLQGRFIDANRSAEELSGYGVDELRRMSFHQLCTPELLSFAVRHFEEMLLLRSREVETTMIRKDGRRVELHLTGGPITVDGNVVGLFGIARDVTQRKRLERTRAEKQTADALLRYHQQLGQDLHDGLVQQLTGLGMMAKSLQRRLQERGLEEADSAEALRKNLRDAENQARAMLKGLRPVEVDAQGLMAALEQLADGTRVRFDKECVFECEDPVPVEDNHTATQLFHIAQEAVVNAVRHSQARRITIRLLNQSGGVRLAVVDDGSGIGDSGVRTEGIGLSIMRYRARLIGAGLEIGPADGGGTAVTCDLRQSMSDE